MNKKIHTFIVVLCLCMFSVKINAECEDKNIEKWVDSLSIELLKINGGKYPYSYLLMLNNPRNDLKVIASDTYSKGKYVVDYDTEFNNYVIGSEIHFENKEYEFEIYMSDASTICKSEKVKTIKYVVPKYNELNDTVYCDENIDDELCGAYNDVKNIQKAKEKIEKYNNDKIEEEIFNSRTIYEKVWIRVKEYGLFVLIPILIVSVYYLIKISVIKRKKVKK